MVAWVVDVFFVVVVDNIVVSSWKFCSSIIIVDSFIVSTCVVVVSVAMADFPQPVKPMRITITMAAIRMMTVFFMT